MDKEEYLVEFYPLKVYAEAENESEAKKLAIDKITSGELEYEVKKIEKVNN